ncbi:T9SS type A sorting domain-containing protein [Brumimicrobium mesophilum]|uniref:T9SS type A sorting domain-containing protein n=1 Tax=Brumimicrobium mesophilum TaxID=392717 RepID=UPI000D1434E0|nr:T9SS type A sorting domain-containing protein [Brumimicrobium mesophilum]
MNSTQFIFKIKTVLTIVFICFSLSTQANIHNQENSYFEHLSEVNKEWLHFKEACPEGNISFNSDVDRIQLHLNLVIQELKSNIPVHFNEEQVSKRLNLLEKLQDYADKKVFPINLYHSVRTPYFVDHLGTNCAVGQMIYVSGHEVLVSKISKKHNYDYIRDIHTKGLVEWANEFGFTLDELKWIQPGYPPAQTIDQIGEGTNGTVKKVIRNPHDQSVLFAGDFSELDSLPCLGIGSYKNDQLSCLGNGIEGTINDVVPFYTGIFVVGKLIHNGQVYPLAKYDGSWTFMEIPNRSGAIGKLINYGGIDCNYEIVLRSDSLPNHDEIWHNSGNDEWVKKATVNGFISDMTKSGVGRVYGGHFDTTFVHYSFMNTTVAVPVNNVVIHYYSYGDWFGIGADVSDTVKVVKEIGGALFIGGTCSSDSAANNICISRYLNSTLQPIVLNEYGPGDFSINAIAKSLFNSGNKFIFGGEFHFDVGWTYGDNLATYDLVNNSVQALAILDGPVYSLDYNYNDDLFIAGNFHSNQGQTINNLGRITSTLGTNEFITEENVNVYPNPFTSTLNLEGIKGGLKYSILHIDGRIAKIGTVQNERINDLDFLPKGSYLLRIESENGVITKRVLK